MPDDNEPDRISGMREAIHQAVMSTTDTVPEPLASETIVHIVRVGSDNPELLSLHEVKKLCASVRAHLEPQAGTAVHVP